MINYIIGKITLIKPNYLVIEANSIGYLVKAANPFSFELNSETKIYTHMNVREDAIELYGFKTSEEKELFLKLISVKGIGPKSALAIIASGQIQKVILAIKEQNSKYLQSFPGIGPKASQQIILDLHGKIDFSDKDVDDPKTSDIKEALKSLGYSTNEIKSVNSIIVENIDKPVNELLKLVLKKLA